MRLMSMLGTPLAEAKQQDRDTKSTILGLEHDTAEAISCGRIVFWVKQQLGDKLVGRFAEE